MVAILLKRWTRFATESGNGEFALHYVRDQDRREVDFLLTLDSKPHLLFEAKRSDTTFTTPGLYYHHKLEVPLVQIVRTPDIGIRRSEGCVVAIHKLASLC
jgi:hypothetical protein